jgi:hypothetical protein
MQPFIFQCFTLLLYNFMEVESKQLIWRSLDTDSYKINVDLKHYRYILFKVEYGSTQKPCDRVSFT